MRTKDEILIESLYTKILSENKFQPNDPEIQDLSTPSLGEEFPQEELQEKENSKNTTIDELVDAILNYYEKTEPKYASSGVAGTLKAILRTYLDSNPNSELQNLINKEYQHFIAK